MKGHYTEGKGGTISIWDEVLQEVDIEVGEVEETSIMTIEEVATMGTVIDTGIGRSGKPIQKVAK